MQNPVVVFERRTLALHRCRLVCLVGAGNVWSVFEYYIGQRPSETGISTHTPGHHWFITLDASMDLTRAASRHLVGDRIGIASGGHGHGFGRGARCYDRIDFVSGGGTELERSI